MRSCKHGCRGCDRGCGRHRLRHDRQEEAPEECFFQRRRDHDRKRARGQRPWTEQASVAAGKTPSAQDTVFLALGGKQRGAPLREELDEKGAAGAGVRGREQGCDAPYGGRGGARCAGGANRSRCAQRQRLCVQAAGEQRRRQRRKGRKAGDKLGKTRVSACAARRETSKTRRASW